jgi:type IV pilus assembly protein PilE
MKKLHGGFTLIELMIVIAILGILALVAIPTYSSYVVKARRSDAVVSLTGIAQMQEMHYARYNTYAKELVAGAGSKDKLSCRSSCNGNESPKGYYNITVKEGANGAGSIKYGFLLEAIPVGSQATDDAICASFTLNSRQEKNSTNSSGASEPEEMQQCWKE